MAKYSYKFWMEFFISDHCDLPAVWRAKKVKHDLIESWLKYIYSLEFSSWLCNRDNFLFITQAFSMVKYKGVVEIFVIVEFLKSEIATNNLGSRHEIFSKFPLVCSGWLKFLLRERWIYGILVWEKQFLLKWDFLIINLLGMDYASCNKSKFDVVIGLPTLVLKRNWHLDTYIFWNAWKL